MDRCICCNDNKFFKIRKNSYFSLPVYQCRNCGLSVTGENKTLLQSKLNQLYSDNYWNYRNIDSTIKTVYKDSNSAFARTRIKSQIQYCSKFFSNHKKLLEIGCGSGINLIELEKYGFEVTGIEPDVRNVEFINKNLKYGKCINGFWEDIELTEKFDVVWFSHSFEHLLDPKISLKKASSILTNTGIVFIEIPNTQNKNRLESSIFKNPHIYHFTRKSIIELVKSCEFELVSCALFTRKRNYKEKFFRFLEKYFKVKLENAPYHYTKLKNETEANEIRLILKKRSRYLF